MKKSLVISFTAALISFANLSHADFTIHSLNANDCSGLSGQWGGTGHVTNWLIGACDYHGSGQMSDVDDAGHFTLSITADKDSGSFICPSHVATSLQGSCVNGTLSIQT